MRREDGAGERLYINSKFPAINSIPLWRVCQPRRVTLVRGVVGRSGTNSYPESVMWPCAFIHSFIHSPTRSSLPPLPPPGPREAPPIPHGRPEHSHFSLAPGAWLSHGHVLAWREHTGGRHTQPPAAHPRQVSGAPADSLWTMLFLALRFLAGNLPCAHAGAHAAVSSPAGWTP